MRALLIQIDAFYRCAPLMAASKNFHLNFPEICRAETRTLVKTQQFILCMKKIFDLPKHFFTSTKPFVFKAFPQPGFSLKNPWRPRC